MVAQRLQRDEVERLVREVLRGRLRGGPGSGVAAAGRGVRETRGARGYDTGGPNPLVVNVSARHVHVRQDHLEQLFGRGTTLTKLKDLYQDGEFASEQQVNIVVPGERSNRMIPNVRILGPTRDYTQVELSYTDGIYLGIDLPLRISGNHEGTPGCVLVGPQGAVTLEGGVIRAKRHVHMHPDDAAHFGVADGEDMRLRIDGPCGLVFDQVTVRVHPKVKLEIHIDTDEGNACDLKTATHMELVR